MKRHRLKHHLLRAAYLLCWVFFLYDAARLVSYALSEPHSLSDAARLGVTLILLVAWGRLIVRQGSDRT